MFFEQYSCQACHTHFSGGEDCQEFEDLDFRSSVDFFSRGVTQQKYGGKKYFS
jgi:hypothetical protein